MNVRTWFNPPIRRCEVNDQPSMTIPDQTMSIREILDRFARGLPLGGQRVPVYNGEDDDLPDLQHMDLADREEYMESAADELRELKTKIKINEKKKVATTGFVSSEGNVANDNNDTV